jgi:hypothetical protein
MMSSIWVFCPGPLNGPNVLASLLARSRKSEPKQTEDMTTMNANKLIGITIAITALGTAMAADPIGSKKLEGKGAFAAHGLGVATVEGNGRFTVEGGGELLVIADRNDRIEVTGFGQERVDGNKHYSRGSGKVTVTGTDITVMLDGNIDAMRCLGNGSARLVGKGDYSVGKLVGSWQSNGNTIWFIKQK